MGVSVGRKKNTQDSKLVCHYDVTSPLNYTLTQVEVLVVAGGGGGGHQVGGGGGAGGVVYSSSYTVSPGTGIPVTVGLGGNGSASTAAAASNGQNSVFGTISATGGGAGQIHQSTGTGFNGGSGGGGAGANAGADGYGTCGFGGLGVSGQGNRGGRGRGSLAINFSGDGWAGGGGGGASEPGGDSISNGVGGNGGKGLPFAISGTTIYYGGGGGGGMGSGFATGPNAGLGGGGNGAGNSGAASACDAVNGLGGGGGGVRDPGVRAGNGGSGVVIVRYRGPQKATGGTITSVNGYTIHTFTTSGTFTPTTSSTIYGLYDLTERGNNLQLSNTTYNTSGVPSLVFNGTSSHGYNYTVTNPLTSNTATMILWIKPNATQNADTYNGLFAIGIKGCPYGSGYGETFLFSMKQNRTLSMAKWCDDSTGATNVVSSTSWSMVSCVKNGATTRFGVNTTFENTSNTGNANFRGTNLTLGCTDNPGRYYTGEIAVAMLFDSALTDSQITEIYNSYSSRFA